MPEVRGVDKGINPSVKPEKQAIKPMVAPVVKAIVQNKPRLGQGRGKRKQKIPTPPQLSKPTQVPSNTILQ